MKRNFVYLGVVIGLMASSVFSWGINITVGDPNSAGETSAGWYRGGSDTASEFGEVEPAMGKGPDWDLQAFAYNSGNLSILSGFNQKDGYNNVSLGDLFVGGAAANHPDGFDYDQYERNSAFYDYAFVIKLDFDNGKYNVYDLRGTDADWVENAYFWDNRENDNAASGPWRYDLDHSGNSGATLFWTGELTYGIVDNPTANGLAGLNVGRGTHYVSTLFDLSWLNSFGAVPLHLTLECGNDNMSGIKPGDKIPDGGATLLLLGFGISGLALIRRKTTK